MATDVHHGSRGQTLGPLKPAGRIRIDGELFEAASEGEWIDPDRDVVVIGSRASILLVRPLGEGDPPTAQLGERLLPASEPPTSALHAPLALVERCNAIVVGAVAGGVLVLLVWLRGTPWSLAALSVPPAGAVTGFLFQWFVKGALGSVGPREDHRPRAFEIATIVTGGAAIGAWIGFKAGFGFGGLSAGLVLGALLGGVISWLLLFLSL